MPVETRRLSVDSGFNLSKTLDLNTQDFRWALWRDREEVDWHSGVLNGRLTHIRQTSANCLEYRASPGSELDDVLRSYFCLGKDIDAIHSALSSTDEVMRRLVNRYPDLRVLRQPDPWECTAAFICSAMKGPKGISEIVNKIAKKLGECVELDRERRNAFPPPEVVRGSRTELENLNLGLQRDRKVVAAAERILEHGLRLEDLADLTYGEARWELARFDGIGSKIADCIALFALGKSEAFPVDSRVRRA